MNGNIMPTPLVNGPQPNQTKKRLVIVAATIAGIILVALGIIIGISLNSSGDIERMSTTELLDHGEKYLLDMKYKQATVVFNEVIDVEPMNPRGYTGLAEAEFELGDINKAVEVLQIGLERLPDNPTIIAMFDRLIAEQDETGNINNLPTRSSPSTSMTSASDEIGTHERFVLVGQAVSFSYDTDNDISEFFEYIYNESGRRIRTNCSNYINDPHQRERDNRYEYEYDDTGKLIGSSYHYFFFSDLANDILTSQATTTTYEYDDSERVVREIMRYPRRADARADVDADWLTIERIYEYDVEGDLVRKTTSLEEEYEIREYIYEEGLLIQEKISVALYGVEFNFWRDYEYDDLGRVSAVTRHSNGRDDNVGLLGGASVVVIYDYDENGNLTSKRTYENNGNFESYIAIENFEYELITADDDVISLGDEWFNPWSLSDNEIWPWPLT